MPNYNKAILIGHLTRDPEMMVVGEKQTPLAKFGIAVNDGYGERKEVAFIDCAMFGKRAESLGKHFHKGDPILIEGRIRQENWEAKDGTKRSKLTILADSWEFVGGKGSNATAGTDEPAGDSLPF